MIRHVAVLDLKPEITPAQIDAFAAALRDLRTPGMISLSCGVDLGLTAGLTHTNVKFTIVVDLEDVAAFHRYDTDEEHRRIRQEYSVPMTQSAIRAQYEIIQPARD